MTTDAPPIIHSAKLVEYAINDADVEFTDRLEIFVGSSGDLCRLGEMPCLAICKAYTGHGPFQLMFCTEDWEPQATLPFTTIDEAKRKAERGYNGIGEKWTPSPYTDEDVDNFLRDDYDVDPRSEWWRMTCSFCGRTDEEIERLVQAPRATICEQCVADFSSIFAEGRDA